MNFLFHRFNLHFHRKTHVTNLNRILSRDKTIYFWSIKRKENKTTN